MTRPTPEMEAAYRQVAEAVNALDADDLSTRAIRLGIALRSAPDEVIRGAGISLVDLWSRAEQLWPNDPANTVELRRRLIGDALSTLDQSFPDLAIRALLDPASRASQRAERLRLEQLLATSPEGAARRALHVVDRFGHAMVDALGEVVVRSLLIEGARLERLVETPPPGLPAALRLALTHPGWLPDDITRADLAVVVATLDYLRDDLTRLDETLDLADGGPFGESSSEGYLAVLRAAAAIGRFDLAEGDLRLRQAANAVTASGDPSLITAYRGICDLMARTRHQRIGDPLVEIARLKPDAADRTESNDVALILDAHEQLSRYRISDEIRVRLALWRDADHARSSVENRAVLWGICALVAAADTRPAEARAFAQRCREARAQLPADSARAAYLDQLLVAFEGASALQDADPGRAAASLTARLEQFGPDSGSALKTITEAQQSIMHFAAGHHSEALRSGVRALTADRRVASSLPGSSERMAMMATLEPLHGTVLKSAARIGDAHLMAELIEVLRAQDSPTAHPSPTGSQLPLAHSVPPAVGEQLFLRPANPLIDVVESHEPVPVMMPWGSVALISILGERDGNPATVVVPR